MIENTSAGLLCNAFVSCLCFLLRFRFSSFLLSSIHIYISVVSVFICVISHLDFSDKRLNNGV